MLNICYPVPMDHEATYKEFLRNIWMFACTWELFPPGTDCRVMVVTCNGDAEHDLRRAFREVPSEFIRYDGNGCDIGAAQFVADKIDGWLTCMTTRCYFHREGWAARLMSELKEDGLYGVSASSEGGHKHICTRGYTLKAETFQEYPVRHNSRDLGVTVEVGIGDVPSLTQWYQSRAMPVRIVHWDQVRTLDDYTLAENRFRNGNQRNMLVWDKHTGIYHRADESERKRLSALSDGLNL